MTEGYTIGDMERILGLKAHVIRYWEREIPLLKPKKDSGGRRVYSGGELRLLLRLKYLLHVRRFTIEGARDELFLERAGNQDLRAHIDALRSELAELYFLACGRKRRGDERPDGGSGSSGSG